MSDLLYSIRDAANMILKDRYPASAEKVCRAADLLELAIKMREAQRVYFKDRSRDNLIAAKQLEAEFDKAVKS
jgi:hypothetical protein